MIIKYEPLWVLHFSSNSVKYWENILDPGEHANENLWKRRGRNPAWMKALYYAHCVCIMTSSVLLLHHHQESKASTLVLSLNVISSFFSAKSTSD